MSNDTPETIEAQPAPLSHLATAGQNPAFYRRLEWRSIAVLLLVVAALIALVVGPSLLSSDQTAQPAAAAPQPSEQDSPMAQSTPASSSQLPPFAQAQKAKARTTAQASLTRFVELQIQLEETLKVDSWAADELAAALSTAKSGDQAFLDEEYQSALNTYHQATEQLSAILQLGDEKFRARLDLAAKAIENFAPEAALEAAEAALVIKPDNKEAQLIYQRASRLPEIISLLRTAKNHELSQRFEQAQATYAAIGNLDPLTANLAALVNAARANQSMQDLNRLISDAFSQLNQGNFNKAKAFFDQALAIEPENPIAKGGLEQVAQQYELNLIAQHQTQAEAAIAAEQWQIAMTAYQAVLDLDANVQFALNGINAASVHLRTQQVLDKITAEPQKLSSEKLFLQAETILQDAQTLPHAGPTMNRSIQEVSVLLSQYRDPVEVVLRSDNATEIIMSNIGRLGTFEHKTLTLRPGQYTIRGSQAGCRDIFINVQVLPGIEPLNLYCTETINLN